MSQLVQWMDRTLYPIYEKNWDDLLFRRKIIAALRPDDTVLDLGAGAGIVSAMNFRGMARRVCGVDPDPRVTSNPFLDEGKQAFGESIPYPDEHFDLVFADNVLEHLPDPVAVFTEVARVLKPGGRFMAKTPNRAHYIPLLARLTPLRFHRYINRKRGRAEEDTFPTRYRVNSPADIIAVAREAGLMVESIELHEGRPEYLRLSAPTYAFGWMYERAVNTIPGLQCFRVLLVVSLRKPEN